MQKIEQALKLLDAAMFYLQGVYDKNPKMAIEHNAIKYEAQQELSEIKELLKSIEYNDLSGVCPVCSGVNLIVSHLWHGDCIIGHKPDCKLAKFIEMAK